MAESLDRTKSVKIADYDPSKTEDISLTLDAHTAVWLLGTQHQFWLACSVTTYVWLVLIRAHSCSFTLAIPLFYVGTVISEMVRTLRHLWSVIVGIVSLIDQRVNVIVRPVLLLCSPWQSF